MKKLGVVNAGSYTQGVNLLVHHLIRQAGDRHLQIAFIEKTADTNGIAYRVMNASDRIAERDRSGGLRTVYYGVTRMECREWLANVDKVLVLDDHQGLRLAMAGLDREELARMKTLPTSIYSETLDHQRSLGYDTALNSVVTCIMQVKDSAGSLVYPVVRLFCIQIPGRYPNSLLFHTATAVEGEVLVDEEGNLVLEQARDNLQKKYSSGIRYAFLIVNESVDPAMIQQFLSNSFAFDFKVVRIDEALCMGNPTAADRVLARRMAEDAIAWAMS